MGREIRRVPPNWEHPVYEKGHRHAGSPMPCVDEDYETAAKRWKREYAEFEAGTHPACKHTYINNFWDYDPPPNEDFCRPAFSEEPTWFQVYETVSEGTPVTPPFATERELVDWLVEKGEMYGTQYERRFSREAATRFVKAKWAPSGVYSGGRIKIGIDSCAD